MPYRDRGEAGRKLAPLLDHYAGLPDVIVLGLPRGGVPVAYEVARALHVPLDIMLVRKLGVPGWEELAMGALASGGSRVLNQDVIRGAGIPVRVIEDVTAREQTELERRERLYRGDRRWPQLSGKTVILVDDGLATGSTMRAAIAAVRKQRPTRIVVAVPTSSPRTCEEIAAEVGECVCAETPEYFYAVGQSYEQFPPVSDEEIQDLLALPTAEPQPMARTLEAV